MMHVSWQSHGSHNKHGLVWNTDVAAAAAAFIRAGTTSSKATLWKNLCEDLTKSICASCKQTLAMSSQGEDGHTSK